MSAKDVAVPLVFPDYLIAVDTPAFNIDVPDVLPGIPKEIHVPGTKNRLPYLGHAGILFFNAGGLTKYYEYGRYDPRALGLVRKQPVPNLRMGRNGRPRAESLKTALTHISHLSGQGGRIEGVYVELGPGAFQLMLNYATSRMAQNTNPKRPPYELLSNSCLHFMRDTAKAGGADMPMVIDPRPAGYMDKLEASFPKVHLKTKKLEVEGIELS